MTEDETFLLEDVVEAACVVMCAALPEGATLGERLIYEDSHLQLFFIPMPRTDGRLMFAVSLYTRDPVTGDARLVLEVWVVGLPPGVQRVGRFAPGAWCTHLLMLKTRAEAVLAGRNRDAE